MKRTLMVVACAVGLMGQGLQAAELKLDNDEKKLSYIQGYQFAQNLVRQGIKMDAEAFSRAVYDVLSVSKPALSVEEMQAVVQRVQKKAEEKRLAASGKNKQAGEAFLASNKAKDGVKSTKSGLQYKVVRAGTGKSPKATDKVEVHYEGRLINGKVFDSSIQRGKPISFGVNQVIKGWTEALQLMKEGARWQLYIPSQLAYGESGAPGAIGPNETLIFDVELIKVN